MTRFPVSFQGRTREESSRRTILVLVLMLLLCRLTCNAESVSECCRQPSRSCRLFVLLCRPAGRVLGGALRGDAAAGILTLGKRKDAEYHLQSRLHQLLQGSRNQAAGILTMGRRSEDGTGARDGHWGSVTEPPRESPAPLPA